MTQAAAPAAPLRPAHQFLEAHGWVIVSCIAVMVMVLGLHTLDVYLPNPDEGIYYRIATQANFRNAWNAIQGNAHPPLYYLVVRAMTVFGDQMLWLRLPSLLCAVLAIFGMWRLGRRVGGPATGILAPALLAVSPAFVVQSQIMRPYSMLVMLLVFGFLFLARAVQDERWRDALLFSLFFTLAACVHYSASLVFAAVGTLLAIAAIRRKLRRRLLIQLGTAYLPIAAASLFFFFYHIRRKLQGSVLQSDAMRGWLGPFFLGPSGVGEGVLWMFLYLFGMLAGVVALLAFAHGIGVCIFKRRHALYAIPLLAIVWGLLFSLAEVYPFGGSRHCLYMLPLIVLPTAFGAAYWVERGLIGAGAFAVSAGLTLASGTAIAGAVGVEQDVERAVANGKPLLAAGEQLTPIGTRPDLQAQLARLKSTAGFILLTEPSFLTLQPLIKPTEGKITRKPGKKFKTFRWGERTVLVNNHWGMSADRVTAGQEQHLVSIIEKIADSPPGDGLDEATDVGLLFSGWPQPVINDLISLNREQSTDRKFIGQTVQAPGYTGFEINVANYLRAAR
jgi:4-amino-4-deoxy-L-arabinose transferase-like glycosyltransferase